MGSSSSHELIVPRVENLTDAAGNDVSRVGQTPSRTVELGSLATVTDSESESDSDSESAVRVTAKSRPGPGLTPVWCTVSVPQSTALLYRNTVTAGIRYSDFD